MKGEGWKIRPDPGAHLWTVRGIWNAYFWWVCLHCRAYCLPATCSCLSCPADGTQKEKLLRCIATAWDPQSLCRLGVPYLGLIPMILSFKCDSNATRLLPEFVPELQLKLHQTCVVIPLKAMEPSYCNELYGDLYKHEYLPWCTP